MNLQPIHPPLRWGQGVRCQWCWATIETGGHADLDGKAFIDYYCEPCRIVVEKRGNTKRVAL